MSEALIFEKDESKSLKKENQERLANLFVLLALIFGIIFIFLEPPFVCPDENAHFINICHISHGHLFASVENGFVGGYMTTEEYDFLQMYGGYFNGSGGAQFDFETMTEMSARTASEDLIFLGTPYTTINPFPYLLPSVFLMVMRFLGVALNAYNSLIFSKIVNLIFYSFIIRWAIKKTGALPKTMFLLALMPMAIFQGASTSYDAYLIPSAFLLFAFATKILCADKGIVVKLEDIIGICIATLFVVGCKIAYAPLILILLSISIKKFGSVKRYLGCIGCVIAVCCIAYIIPTFINSSITSAYEAPLSELSAMQQNYFRENYMHFPKVIQATLNHFGGYWLESFFGILGWLDTQFPRAFVLLFFIISTFSAFVEASSTKKIPFSTRIFSLLGVGVFFVGTLYTMYVEWNPLLVGIVGGDLAYGGQGRYFIPVALFVVIAFASPLLYQNHIGIKLQSFVARVAPVTSISYLMLTMMLLTVRYWC